MYRICILDNTGSGVPVVPFHAQVRGFSKQINAPGKMTFALPHGDPDALSSNLQKWRHVQLLRDATPVWYGTLQADRRNGNYIDVVCEGALGILRKRYASTNQSFTGQGSTDMFSLLAATNGLSNTGILQGTGGVTSARSLTMQGDIDILHVLELRAAADQAEFEVDDTAHLNYMPSLGSDKSATVTLRYRRDGVPDNNLSVTEIGEDAQYQANRVIGHSTASGGLTSTWNDPADQTPNGKKYPILVENKQFDEARDQTTLDKVTESYGKQRAVPLPGFRADVILGSKKFDPLTGNLLFSGFSFGDFGLGDLVLCDIVTENLTIQEARRVVAVDVAVDENLKETVSLTLSKAGVFITADYLDGALVPQMKRRIQEIEALL